MYDPLPDASSGQVDPTARYYSAPAEDADKRLRVIVDQARFRCEICADTDGIQVHHVRRLADLHRRGQPQPAWAQLMARRRRKTLIVCKICHDTIHAGKRGSHRRAACGESRMRGSGWGPLERTRIHGHLADGPTSTLRYGLSYRDVEELLAERVRDAPSARQL